MKKIFFFLIDGISDLPNKNTPLRLAKKFFLDKISHQIHLSYIYPIKKKYWPKQGNYSVSGIANLHLLGYKIKPEYFKRGPYEALGSNIKFKKGWLVFRANFSTIDDNFVLIDRRAGRNIYGLNKLTEEINKIKFEIPFGFYHTSGHRGVLVFKKILSDKISENDPYKINKKIKKIKALNNNSLSIKTANLVNKFLELIYYNLKDNQINQIRKKIGILPANYLLLREPGNKLLKLKNFFKKYNIKNGLVIATNGVDKGTCLSVGFKKYDLSYPKNIFEEFKNIKKSIIKNYHYYQILYCHFKKADEYSHDKNFEEKKNFFEKFDLFLNDIYKKFKDDIFVITGDHITSIKDGEHKFGPVPLILINTQLKNNPKEISELEALKLGEFFKENNQLWKFLKNNVS